MVQKKSYKNKARLDYFSISESLFADVDESYIYPGYRTDDSMVMLQFQFGKFKKGRSYWKMNNSLLKDHHRKHYSNVRSRYAVNDQNPNVNITDIPNSELLL